MKLFFISLFLYLLFSLTNLLSQAAESVTASDYCLFLNSIPSADSLNFYDQKIGSDSQQASIVCKEINGIYYYSVIEGRENEPISYISKFSRSYYTWRNHLRESIPDSVNFENRDDSLKSNKDIFLVEQSSVSILSLASSQTALVSYVANSPDWIKEVAIAVMAVGLMLAPENLGANGASQIDGIEIEMNGYQIEDPILETVRRGGLANQNSRLNFINSSLQFISLWKIKFNPID